MKAILSAASLFVLLSISPAASMCGGGQQSQTGGQAGMCGGSASSTTEDPFGMKQPAPQQRSMGMCPCCRNMASMGGMNMQGYDPHKGMNMTPK